MVLLDEFLSRVGASPEGDGWVTHCPAHADSHASLRLSVGQSRFLLKCRAGCESSAVLAALGLSFSDLPDVAGVGVSVRRVSADVPASAEDVAGLAVRLDGWAGALAGSGADAYARERFGLTDADLVRLGLGFAGDLGGGGRLVVPFRDAAGVARGFQARALDAAESVRWLGPKNPKEGTWAKLGVFPGASGWDEVLVCEGPGDALTGCGLGYDTVGVRGAALASNPAVADELAAYVGDRIAVLAGDGDPSGRAFSATLAAALTERGVRAKILPVPEKRDLTSWREADASAFTREVVRAIQSAPLLASNTAALAARDESEFPLTDLGNARFVRAHIRSRGSDVRYSPEAGFFLLDGGVWRRDESQETRTHVQAASEVTAAIAATLAEAAGTDTARIREARRWASWARHSQSSRGIDAALRELEALSGVAVSLSAFDRHEHLLACRNGVVDLRTGELLAHDPAFLLTRRMDCEFDPEARAPRWEAFLEEVFPKHPELPAYIRRLVGYGITGSTAEQCFAVLWGTGANGKSVFTDTLTEVFREFTVTTPFSTFEERPAGGIPNDIAALKGSRLVMASEGEAGKPMAEAVLKRVTGRDLITARFMRKEFFEFRPTFLLMLATNAKPNFRGQDEGLWRRVKLIPWERYFAPAERDHRLGRALLAEREGILAWAVRGAREWYAGGGLADPEVVVSATREYRETSDHLAGFLGAEERPDYLSGFTVTHDAKDWVLGSVLWSAYRDWTEEQALPARERWTQRQFFGALEERGLVKKKRNSGVTFLGVRKARVADSVPEHDAPERAEGGGMAYLPSVIGSGPSLDSVL